MINKLTITVLSENCTQRPDLLSEHGLSLYIEADEHAFLFDTGAGVGFLQNAEVLGLDVQAVDGVVLSHGHYDHTGGLVHVRGLDVYAHPDLFIPKYARRSFFRYEYIGNEYSRQDYIKDNELHIHDVTECSPLFPDVLMMTGFSKKGLSSGFYIKPVSARGYQPDLFSDELALAIRTYRGLVVITGCAHSGIMQIIEKALQVSGTKKLYAVLGGFHLSKASAQKNKQVAHALNGLHIPHIGISHCTGQLLAPHLSSAHVFPLNCGDVFRV